MMSKSRPWFIAAVFVAAAMVLVLPGCGGWQLPQDQGSLSNEADYVMVDSLNASGGVIGKRAVVAADKADFKGMGPEGLDSFVSAVVIAAGDCGADYLTVDFGDGTGLTFPACSGDFFFYGKLDKEGMMAGECETYRHFKDNWARY